MRDKRKETAFAGGLSFLSDVNILADGYYNGPKIAKFVLLSVIVQITIAA